MGNMSDTLMRSGVMALCADCGNETIFVPVDDGCDAAGCEFCCTGCDAAVFLLPELNNVRSVAGSVTSVA
jgi:hypothetical protein